MVIQRLQTVYLLLAAVVMGFFPWVPFGEAVSATEGTLTLVGSFSPYILMLILGYVACGLLVADIFMFKNFKLQKGVLGVTLLLLAVIMGFVAYYNIAADTNGYDVYWAPGSWMLVVAFVLSYMALRRIKRDESIIRSYNRMR